MAHIWSAARPSKAYDVLVNYALAHTAASLERLTLFLPLRHGPLPAMGRLQHVTLQLDSSFAGLKLNWKGMPQLQTIVLLHANTEEDDCIGPMFLAELTHLQSLYLGNVVPFELYLPPSCALHLHCSRAAESRLCNNPGWFQAQRQLVSLCQRLLSAALPYQANVFVPLRGLDSLTALSVVSSTQVDVGAPGAAVSLMPLPALQRLVLDTAGNVHIHIPRGTQLKRLWARRLINFNVLVESADEFVHHIDAMCLDIQTCNSEEWVEVMAALEKRGTPLVMRQPHPSAASIHVIQGCMYDVEAETKPACACQICLDCLVRRTCRPSEMPAAMDRVLF